MTLQRRVALTTKPRRRALAQPQRRHWLTSGAVLLGALAAGGLSACGRRKTLGRGVPVGSTVLALGDSLTFGTGAAPETSYPAVLAGLSGWQIVNAGVPGDTSAQALERLPALLQEHKPALVLVSIGGNDLLRRLPEADTRANLQRICELAQGAGAQVLVLAVPRPTVASAFIGSLSDHPMYAEVSAALKLPLLAQGWAAVLADETLRSDQIHANARGYAQMARSVYDAARVHGLVPAR
ncbi:MAG TPA: GDSL-type esterase/lipase family protein [Burkholderiaceae bacterium]|nr:GDSL-type esterase/lipase family protein [Burkholderiaceae bacterium]